MREEMPSPFCPHCPNDRSAVGEAAGSWRSLAAILATVAVLAVWINFGELNRYHYGDSIVPVLMSLYRWTPFYWEQDRLGSLLPLLARPFTYPLTNMLVQYITAVWFGISAFFLGARYVLGRGPWIATGAIAAGIYMGFQPSGFRFEMIMTQHQYGTSLALAFGGLILMDQVTGTRAWIQRAFGIAAMCLALWVNVSLIASLLPVIVLRDWPLRARLLPSQELAGPAAVHGKPYSAPVPDGTSKRSGISPLDGWLPIAGLTGAFVLSAVWSRFGKYHHSYAILPLSQIGPTWLHLWQNVFAAFPGFMWAAAAALLALALSVLLTSRGARQPAMEGLCAALPLLAGALGHATFMSSLNWAAQEHYMPRYLIVSIILTLLAVTGLSSTIIFEAIGHRWRNMVTWAAMIGFAGSMFVLHGVPSLSTVRADIDRSLGRLTREIIQAECTHVIGSYWVVWPAVFHANLELFERRDGRVVWGIAHRCAPTKKFWSKVPPEQTKIAAAIGDNEVEKIAEIYQVGPLVEERQLQTIRILRPAGFDMRVR